MLGLCEKEPVAASSRISIIVRVDAGTGRRPYLNSYVVPNVSDYPAMQEGALVLWLSYYQCKVRTQPKSWSAYYRLM